VDFVANMGTLNAIMRHNMEKNMGRGGKNRIVLLLFTGKRRRNPIRTEPQCID
jgi:hypothetical protein